MRRIYWYSLLMLMLVASPSSAIQLRWSTSSQNLTFTSAVRCTLVVQADSAEVRLPSEWRLLWVADSSSIQFVAMDSLGACVLDEAQVSRIDAPATAADSAANMITAHFCSVERNGAVAQQVLDLPAGGRGKLMVVALDPSDPDSSRVIQSGLATFNGGVETPFPSVILGASTTHQSTDFRLRAVGTGLAQTHDLALAAPDGSWRLPLSVEARGDSAMTATASIAASVPACAVEAAAPIGGITSAYVPGDPPPPPLEPQSGCQDNFIESIYPPDMIQPKDFAFVPGGWTPSGSWTFHFLYIRQNQETKLHHGGVDFTEKNIGHAVSNDLHNWTVLDTAAIEVRPGRFDSQHVWAPTIVLRGLTYYMFYTGVDAAGNQRIGLATSTDLVTWAQGDSVFQVSQAGTWVDPAPLYYGGAAQLRDPFVMEDPDVPGDWLMYFVTVAKAYTPGMVVGVARSHGDFSAWLSSMPFWSTRFPYPTDTTAVVESPHAFLRNGKWWLFYTVNGDSVWAESSASGPADTSAVQWTQVQKLRTLVPADEATAYNFWHATEYLQYSADNDLRYLAAFNDANESISYTRMRAANPPYLFAGDCPSVADVDDAAQIITTPRLLLTGLRPARSRIGFRIELPGRARVFLAVYDVMGRRMKTLADGDLPAGATELSWDGHDTSGAMVGSGIYFVSLTTAEGRHAVRVPLIR